MYQDHVFKKVAAATAAAQDRVVHTFNLKHVKRHRLVGGSSESEASLISVVSFWPTRDRVRPRI